MTSKRKAPGTGYLTGYNLAAVPVIFSGLDVSLYCRA